MGAGLLTGPHFLRKGGFCMETILHLLPLTPEQQAAFQAAAPEAEHLFLPTHDRRGARDIPQDWRERVTILMGFVPPQDLKTFPRLKWVQSWNAGVDPYLAPGVLPDGVVLTCAAGAYGPAVSEHMLAMLLAIYKRLPDYRDRQRRHTWQDLGPVQSLHGKTVLVGGTGDISRHFALLCRAMGAKTVWGLHRSDAPVEGFDQTFPLSAIDGLLPQAHVVALALPHNAETAGLLNKRCLLLMKEDAVLLNAGRGSAVDCATLAEVLSQGHLLGAGLDVTSPEPLPPDHPLWDAPRALLTPHTAGGYDHMALTLDNLSALFLDNLNRWLGGQPLRSRMK